MEPLRFPLRIPFVEELGLELWAYGDGQAELRVDLAEAHLNSWEVAHGGVLMTMLDVAMAHAARSAALPASARSAALPASARSAALPASARSAAGAPAPDLAPGVATVEMKTSFMRPAEGRLRAHGTLLHRTSTMAFTEGRVVDETGQICAHATGTFKFLRALPARGRRTQALQRADPAADAARGNDADDPR